ncbi:MAG: sulfurtransferase TusA [Agarilytica sp.]
MSKDDSKQRLHEDISTTVDAKGLICPEPVMMLHSAVRDAKGGQVIQVLATDPSTKKDIAQFCEFLGHELLDQSLDGDVLIHLVRKKIG